MSIELHIERLVIDEALLHGERLAAVRASMEHALTRQLSKSGSIDALRGMGAVATLSPATLSAADHHQADLGTRVAHALLERLTTPAADIGGKR